MVVYFVVLAVMCIAVANGDLFSSSPATKIWVPDTNFGTPSNWYEDQVPCSNQRIVFPAELSVSVFLQTNTSVREMVLPLNGEIAFGSDVQLVLGATGQAQSDCPMNDAKFWPVEASEWYSPQSWRMENEQMDLAAPVPETERIPCQTDEVIFPTNTSFKAKLKGPAIKINSISIAAQIMNTSTFQTLTETVSGKLHFERSTTVDITQQTCNDVTGCVCRTNTEEVKSVVCKLAKCPNIDCSDTVTPTGSCCGMCGSVVTTRHDDKFVWATLHKLYSSFLAKPDYINMLGYVSKIDNNHVQAVFTDPTAAHKATQIALALKDYLDSDINNGLHTFGVTSVTIQTSSHWIAHELTGSGLSIGSVMGIIFAFIAVIALGLGALAMYKTHCIINLPFGRLYEDFKEGTAVHFDSASEAEDFPVLQQPLANIEGFDNPMYQTPSTQPPSYDNTSFGPGVGTVEIRQNPVFMAFGEEEDLQ